MSPEEIKLLMSTHTEAFKACLEFLSSEYNRRMDKLEHQVKSSNEKLSDLERSLQFTQNEFDKCKERVSELENDKSNLTSEINELKSSVAILTDRVNYMEDSSRRPNLLFDEFPDAFSESHIQNGTTSQSDSNRHTYKLIH